MGMNVLEEKDTDVDMKEMNITVSDSDTIRDVEDISNDVDVHGRNVTVHEDDTLKNETEDKEMKKKILENNVTNSNVLFYDNGGLLGPLKSAEKIRNRIKEKRG